MIRLYVPSSHGNGLWTDPTNTALNAGNWSAVSPGSIYSFGDVCSADYRSDLNYFSTTGKMGERITYTFLPFILSNEYDSPHTRLYDVGFSTPVTLPASKSTGLNSNNEIDSVTPVLFSNGGANRDSGFSSAPNFLAYSSTAFGFNILGMAKGIPSIWDLTSTGYYWSILETVSGKYTISPETLASAVGYCNTTGKASYTLPISPSNLSLGTYTPYKWLSGMKTGGTLSYAPIEGNTLVLERTASLWGFFYFIVVDSSNISSDVGTAEMRYETNLVTSGSPGDVNYYYPEHSLFQIQNHGKWKVSELGVGSNPPSASRSMWWGEVDSARESRTGWYVAGKRVD